MPGTTAQHAPSVSTIGTRIAQARGDLLTREQLAAAAGVSVDAIERYERGIGAGPSFVGLCAIAAITRKPLVWFLEEGQIDRDASRDERRASDVERHLRPCR